MLDIAKKKIKKNNIPNKSISLMDGEALSFPDNSFNKVVAMYVISVTQNPEKLIKQREFASQMEISMS